MKLKLIGSMVSTGVYTPPDSNKSFQYNNLKLFMLKRKPERHDKDGSITGVGYDLLTSKVKFTDIPDVFDLSILDGDIGNINQFYDTTINADFDDQGNLVGVEFLGT